MKRRSISIHRSTTRCSAICKYSAAGAAKKATFPSYSLPRRSPHAKVVLSTSEIPLELETIGDPVFIQSCVTEKKTDLDTRENGANLISRLLPFVEVRLYNQLLVKLQSLRCNAVFGLSVEMEIGGSLLVATITGTAVYIPGLPEPGAVSIRSPFPPTKDESRENYEHVTVGARRGAEA